LALLFRPERLLSPGGCDEGAVSYQFSRRLLKYICKLGHRGRICLAHLRGQRIALRFNPFEVGLPSRSILGSLHFLETALKPGQDSPHLSRSKQACAISAGRDSAACTGKFFIDDAVLAAEGVNNLERYIAVPGSTFVKGLFVA
jgi:hypothetical protein